MRAVLIILLAVATPTFASSSAPQVKGIEGSQSLGHDFWLITVAARVKGGFESIGHFSYCYYKNKSFGQCDLMSPSPSGRYAIYQQGPSGLVMFFDSRTGLTKQVTPSFPGLLGATIWREADQQVEFKAGESGAEKTITFNFHGAVGGT